MVQLIFDGLIGPSVNRLVGWQNILILALGAVISLPLLYRTVFAARFKWASRSKLESSPTFLTLPRELRDQVYRNLIVESGPVSFKPTIRKIRALDPSTSEVSADHIGNAIDKQASRTGLGSNLPFRPVRETITPPQLIIRNHSITASTTTALPWPFSRFREFYYSIISPSKSKPQGGSSFLLVNHKLHDEYALALCHDGNLSFRLNAEDEDDGETHVWPSSTFEYLGPKPQSEKNNDMRHRIRRLDVTVELKSQIGPNHIPDDVQSFEHSRIFQRSVDFISQFQDLRDLHIRIELLGDVIVNPIVKWQAFANLYQPLFPGPTTTLSFSLSGWNVKGNVLTRPGAMRRRGNEKVEYSSTWGWSCGKGHTISDHVPHKRPVLYFYSSLYRECRECRDG